MECDLECCTSYTIQKVEAKKAAEVLKKNIGKSLIADIQSFDTNIIKDEDTLILGCAAYGDEELSQYMLSFIDNLDYRWKGKVLGLFGTYGGGNGLWIDLWVEKMKDLGADVIGSGLRVPRDAIEEFSYDEYSNFFNR